MVSPKKVLIVVADSTRMGTELVAEALKRETAFEVVTCDFDLRLLSQVGADVAVIGADTADQPMKGCELARELRALAPATKVILLVDTPRRDVVLEAFRVQVRGIFCRTASLTELSKCIKQVYRGQVWAGCTEMQYVLEEFAAVAPPKVDPRVEMLLSRREQQVVRCVAEGMSNRETAEHLNLSEHTIKNYLFRTFDKLGVASRAELIYLVFTSPALLASPSQPSLCPDEASKLDWCRTMSDKCCGAQLTLAESYRNARGAGKDSVTAYMWFFLAELTAKRQANASRKARLRLRTKLKPAELAEAERRALEWLKKTQNSAQFLCASVSKCA